MEMPFKFLQSNAGLGLKLFHCLATTAVLLGAVKACNSLGLALVRQEQQHQRHNNLWSCYLRTPTGPRASRELLGRWKAGVVGEWVKPVEGNTISNLYK